MVLHILLLDFFCKDLKNSFGILEKYFGCVEIDYVYKEQELFLLFVPILW